METLLTLSEVCKILSISTATGRNWVRLGKLVPQSASDSVFPLFSSSTVDLLKKSLQNGTSLVLKSRRNKKYISGNGTDASYPVSDCSCYDTVNKLLQNLPAKLTSDQLQLLLCDCALQLMADAGISAPVLIDYLIPVQLKSSEITSLIRSMYQQDFPNVEPPVYHYLHGEDTLGLLYTSLHNIGNRKAFGAYYTPFSVIHKLIDHLPVSSCNSSVTLLDPSCGTGGFLLHLPSAFHLANIYGCDIDAIAISIARINLAMHFSVKNDSEVQTICNNLKVMNWLVHDFFPFESCSNSISQKIPLYDFIIGNPPWGSDFSSEELTALRTQYRCARNAHPESYTLFIEQSLLHLKPNGILSFVLPETLLQVKKHLPCRQLIYDKTFFRFLAYLGDAFKGVQCPCIILEVQNRIQIQSPSPIMVQLPGQNFSISVDHNPTPENFHLLCDNYAYEIVEKMKSNPHILNLLHNADFAMGIVTGSNDRLICSEKEDENEPILRGSNIFRYGITPPQAYISYNAAIFQQTAPEKFYRAAEKLFYRFISSELIFAYDNQQLLSLNSCNILIPHLPGIRMRYIMAVLNSRIMQFYYSRTFHSVKVLRSALEQLPIPCCDIPLQNKIAELTIQLSASSNAKQRLALYNDIDRRIASLFSLSDEEYHTIINLEKTSRLLLFV